MEMSYTTYWFNMTTYWFNLRLATQCWSENCSATVAGMPRSQLDPLPPKQNYGNRFFQRSPPPET